uniref:tRNA pseudouridine synthase n=1 Tax=Haptolina brevifila TaxID=156173 RepID=A0A7S2IMH4_9EUKA
MTNAAVPANASSATAVPLGTDATARLRALLRTFEGTQSFHNFTDGKVTSADKTATRYMISITTGEPLMLSGVPYVPIRFHGQSFLLHQIRKMVGLTAATFRGDVPPDAIEVALRPGRIAPIPMAPSCALVLRRCLYTPYERKRNAEKFSDRNSVHFPESDAAKERFVTENILPHIAQCEAAGEFERFAEALSNYTLERKEPSVYFGMQQGVGAGGTAGPAVDIDGPASEVVGANPKKSETDGQN